jgi:uncharacterized membrane protein
MSPGLRKAMLTAHITTSVGWLGAVAVFLVLALAGLTATDAERMRAAYLATSLTASYVIVPLCLASLVTGLAQSLGTEWGLFRHYWILVKLIITAVSTALLLLHLQPIGSLATVAEQGLAATGLQQLRFELVFQSSSALVVLLVATVLSVYKPRGITPYGWRKQQAARGVPQS